MWCMGCQKDLYECSCPDMEERMDKLAQCKHLLLPKCGRCEKIVYACKCPKAEA